MWRWTLIYTQWPAKNEWSYTYRHSQMWLHGMHRDKVTFACIRLLYCRKSLFSFIVDSQTQENTGTKSVQICETIYYLPTWCNDYYSFIKYYSPLYVSSLKCSSSGGYSCIHAAYGTVTLYDSSWWLVGTQLEWVLTQAVYRQANTNSHRVTVPYAASIQLYPPEDEHLMLETCRGE